MSDENLFLLAGEKISDREGRVEFSFRTKWQQLTDKLVARVATANETFGTITPEAEGTYKAIGLTGDIVIAAPSGQHAAEQRLVLYFKDNGSARGITWTTSSTGFRASAEVSLPSTTVAGKWMRITFVWNSDDSFWDAVGAVNQL